MERERLDGTRPRGNGYVYALAVLGTNVYVGGEFDTAGGSPAKAIAKWDGSTWTALGSGMAGISIPSVNALALSGSDLYAGGCFTTAGGTPVNHVAKWNGTNWTNFGSGMNDWVFALAVSGSDVYAGGWFSTAGGRSANRIAKWNGSSWSPLGSGLNETVRALAVSGSDLYAGGFFTAAGGKVSAYVARAYLEQPTLCTFRTAEDVTLSWPLFYDGFALQQSTNVSNSNGWLNVNFPLTTNGPIKNATVPIAPGNQFFRLIGD
jgi:hypothetical protein